VTCAPAFADGLAKIDRNREIRTGAIAAGRLLEQCSGGLQAPAPTRCGTCGNEISYTTGWTISGLATPGTIVAIWLLGIGPKLI
jgi:hypothetical protein